MRVWGPLVIPILEREGHVAPVLFHACADMRMRASAVKMVEAFARAGGTGWEQLVVAGLTNSATRLIIVDHVLPAVLRACPEDGAKRLLACAESAAADASTMVRLVLAARCLDVVPSHDTLRSALLGCKPWPRRYALDAAIHHSLFDLVDGVYLRWITKEASQNHRTATSGSLGRWWRTKRGNQMPAVAERETRMSWNLYCGAPHARQATAMMWISRKKSFASATVTAPGASHLQVMLVEMLCSRYDALRLMAFDALREHFRGVGLFADQREREALLRFATTSIRCIRVRIADGGARLFALLFDASTAERAEGVSHALDLLRKHVELGHRDFAKVASTHTLHGPLMVLRLMLRDAEVSAAWTAPQTARLVQLCSETIELCKPYVCDNKLEGMSENVKMAMGASDDEGSDDEVDDADDGKAFGSHIRVCAWRGVREACLALGAALHSLMALMSMEDMQLATDSLLTICLQSKHRGALENASIGLHEAGIACLRSTGPAAALPRQWVMRVLHFDPKMVGTARRSAGIPFAICAVLRAEAAVCNRRDANPPLVTLAMDMLMASSSQGQDHSEQQQSAEAARDQSYYVAHVHYLNILRHLVRDGSLADILRPFLERVLLLALRMWRWQQWSIRNSASLLFAAGIRKVRCAVSLPSLSLTHTVCCAS